MTTGSFPQELVIQLESSATIKNVTLLSSGIQKVELAKCDGSQANTWETISSYTAEDGNEKITLPVQSRITATYLRIKVWLVIY